MTLLTVQADPLNLAPIEQTIENEPAKQILSVDLNGDGKADLLTLASDGTSVRVLLSGGRGRPSGTLFRLWKRCLRSRRRCYWGRENRSDCRNHSHDRNLSR